MATAPAPGFEAPGVEDFQLPPIFGPVTKPVLELALAAIIVVVLFRLAVRKPQLVPSKTQFLGESFHGIVRNSIAKDMIGPEFLRYVPFLTALFAFILVNNLFGIIPFIQFPTFSHPGVPYALALLVWVIFTVVGIRHHGLGGYLRISTWPPDVPWWVRIILTPIEFISNIILRPVTLSLRLFGNMFAGHLLLLLFILGGQYMLFTADSILLKILSPFAFLMGIVFTFFEAFVQVVQAYIFVMLTASYIGTVLADDH
ncbi:F0F1 ATP synthase subunit A [Pseudonocardia sp.]|jgi:F-type H+-transporting ATPase subunit a|uniref:F0F1 ATP synthase subunit A n=1 Tax=Pseudonocardia sp. TaxID=60912 RepID=UPI00260D6FD9|nr:F0F1 ATP synthase subunit A [Pseudonocardia sp.]